MSAVIAVYAAFSSVAQVNIAKQQNETADRQSLATVVAEMARERHTLSAQNLNQNDSTSEALQANSEQALTLIHDLTVHVPPIDYYETAEAFNSSGEYDQALELFAHAARADHSPHYRAASLLGEAEILYALGRVRQGQADVALAYSAYDGQPDVTMETIYHNEAFTKLWDAAQVAKLDCSQAQTDVHQGEYLTSIEPRIDSDVAIKTVRTSAEQALEKCSSSAIRPVGTG